MHLLPCPFCGSRNPLFNITAHPPVCVHRTGRPGPTIKPGWYVRCRSTKCGARVDGGTAPSAMKRWNTRTMGKQEPQTTTP